MSATPLSLNASLTSANTRLDSKPLRIAVLVSGSGSNLQVLINAMQAGALPIEIVGVISNREDAYAITRAKDADIPVAALSHVASGKRMGIKTFETHASAQLTAWQPDLIVLAGFMRVLSGTFIDSMPVPMINLHPSLLPCYKGLDTHQRVIQAGERHHGCSIHVVTAELDAGQVLTQAVLALSVKDTTASLQARVQTLEHQLLPWTILLIAKGVIVLNNQASHHQPDYLPTLPFKLFFED
ncbi:formyltetrahydrofolate-dependent phosphoribosylglycinamide formyltransferase [Psychrobacter arcticus 273-4]|uniref:Phosphoribosylglycinamide formyltransferase n=1 Tax=Psychrobacter arcticus (strain DSM 17307 / VKM B-2377 / 273-4) TaxID=259536 RepID=Q4FR85_PSYA2|nr:phosphoribosylglycinamide formyltransferase [Psychrobacter arcticus]AAZ19473.1 formyltetrahydrofolate-dependent phosphoribosylglycinamide formyltransferase [Psychrobacter arcticus 273-4]